MTERGFVLIEANAMFKRTSRALSGWRLAGVALSFSLVCCWNLKGETIPILDSGDGWIDSDNSANGNSQTNNYIVGVLGNCCSSVYRNHFDFYIPTFAGVLAEASLNIFEPIGNANAGPELYSLYSLGAFGTYAFSDIGAGSLYASDTITPGYDDSTVDTPLNSTALAALNADQGGTFSLGGKISDETTPDDFVFGSGTNFAAELTLTTITEVPEPSVIALLAGCLAICALLRREDLRGTPDRIRHRNPGAILAADAYSIASVMLRWRLPAWRFRVEAPRAVRGPS
ncbi:MAG: hypothetical protein ABSB86_18965 [Bryobacteraceae bacterium]